MLSVAPGLNEFHMARAGALKVRQTGKAPRGDRLLVPGPFGRLSLKSARAPPVPKQFGARVASVSPL